MGESGAALMMPPTDLAERLRRREGLGGTDKGHMKDELSGRDGPWGEGAVTRGNCGMGNSGIEAVRWWKSAWVYHKRT